MSEKREAIPLADNPEDKSVLSDRFPPLRKETQAGANLRLGERGRAVCFQSYTLCCGRDPQASNCRQSVLWCDNWQLAVSRQCTSCAGYCWMLSFQQYVWRAKDRWLPQLPPTQRAWGGEALIWRPSLWEGPAAANWPGVWPFSPFSDSSLTYQEPCPGQKTGWRRDTSQP